MIIKVKGNYFSPLVHIEVKLVSLTPCLRNLYRWVVFTHISYAGATMILLRNYGTNSFFFAILNGDNYTRLCVY